MSTQNSIKVDLWNYENSTFSSDTLLENDINIYQYIYTLFPVHDRNIQQLALEM